VPTLLLRLADVGVNSTPVAVPDKATVCAFVLSLSSTLNVPVGKPTYAGVNTTSIKQVPPTGIAKALVQVVSGVSLLNGAAMDTAGSRREFHLVKLV
jgi:hypothetical protein